MIRYGVMGVRQTDKGEIVLDPILFERGGRIRSNDQDHCVAFYKLLIVLTQLRQMRFAMRSDKPAEERQYHKLFAPKFRQCDSVVMRVGQCKIGRDFYTIHIRENRKSKFL